MQELQIGGTGSRHAAPSGRSATESVCCLRQAASRVARAGSLSANTLAASVLALNDPALATRLAAWRKQQTDAVKERPEGSA